MEGYRKLILASASPRRRDLLEQLGLNFSVEPAGGDEVVPPGKEPGEIVMALAFAKADRIRQKHDSGDLVLGADTIVVLDGQVLGKPGDRAEACRMLAALSGRTHQVYTGVALLSAEKEYCFYEKTDVVFYPLSKEEIDAYVADGEPMDKAGAYGIQGKGGRFVREIHGDYNNVVGLPIARLYHVLAASFPAWCSGFKQLT